MCKVGADIHSVCQEGDKFMEEEVRKVFNNKKSKKLERGIAFPTCISVNNVIRHFSPLVDESCALAEGDVAKIDLGCHIDGFIAQAAHTIVVTNESGKKITGKKADVILAAHNAMQVAQKMFKLAGKNSDITEMFGKVCEDFGMAPVETVLSHKQKKHLIDGNDVICMKNIPEQKVKDYEFCPGDVFALDIIVSTGEGKPKEGE